MQRYICLLKIMKTSQRKDYTGLVYYDEYFPPLEFSFIGPVSGSDFAYKFAVPYLSNYWLMGRITKWATE